MEVEFSQQVRRQQSPPQEIGYTRRWLSSCWWTLDDWGGWGLSNRCATDHQNHLVRRAASPQAWCDTVLYGIEVWSWRILIFCEKCQVGVVTVGGGWFVSTSGFRFPVGRDLNRSTCSGDLLGNVYFRSERCWKVGKNEKYGPKIFFRNQYRSARTQLLHTGQSRSTLFNCNFWPTFTRGRTQFLHTCQSRSKQFLHSCQSLATLFFSQRLKQVIFFSQRLLEVGCNSSTLVSRIIFSVFIDRFCPFQLWSIFRPRPVLSKGSPGWVLLKNVF